MSIHTDITALAGSGTGDTRAPALCPSTGSQATGIDDMNARGPAGSRGGES